MKILFNARIYTLNQQQPTAAALLLDGARILAAGSLAEIESLCAPDTARHDCHGRTILPGLTDAHIHLEHYALGLQKVDCETASQAECLTRVAARAGQTPAGQWVSGHGWNHNNWAEGLGSAAALDAVAPNHPVYLTAKSLHAAWANSAALQLAGITAATPDPENGRIGRAANGQPDGILYETAMELVANQMPIPTVADVAAAIRSAQPILWGMGLTGVHDFDRRRCFSALQLLRQQGQLGLRVVKSLPVEEVAQAAALGLRSGFGDDWLRIGSVKAFADGALGPQTAAMLQPYTGSSDNRGILMMDAEQLYEHGRLAVESGLSMAVHAIGDRANHEVLNAFAQLRVYERELASPAAPLRHRIEHVQIIHPDDAPRLAALNVIASMQPIHAISDMRMADQHWGERAALSYAWRTQANQGAWLAFGSDAPVDSPNPFWGLHAAVTRRMPDGHPGPQGWYPEQKLTMQEALAGYTRGAAFAAGQERQLGQLAPGYLADLITLESDPFTCSADELYNLRPHATMIAGEWVWQASQ